MRAMLIVLGLTATTGCTDPAPGATAIVPEVEAAPEVHAEVDAASDEATTAEEPVAEDPIVAELNRDQRTSERDHVLLAIQRAEAQRRQRRRRTANRTRWASPEFRAAMWNVETAAASDDGTRYLRWEWGADSAAVPEAVRVADDAMLDATVQGLHRISGSEAGWANERDGIAIWRITEVINRSRAARGCDRQAVSRITECGPQGETHVSSMRRASRYVMGAVPARRARQSWLRAVTVGCEEPEGFPEDSAWEGRTRRLCEAGAELARDLVTGVDTRTAAPRGYTAITWGGRCESGRGACDDPNACRRGLARIPDTGTSNALWCRPGVGRCPDYVVRDGRIYSDSLCADLRLEPERVRAATRRRLLAAPLPEGLPADPSPGRVVLGQVIAPGSPSGPFDR